MMSTTEHFALMPNIQTGVIYDLSKTASKIALQHFQWCFITLVYFNSTYKFGAEIFIQKYGKAVVIGRGAFYPKFVSETNQYVLFENSVTDMVQTLEWMRVHQFDNTGKYVIVCESLDKRECDERVAMQALWEFKIINVILLKSVNNETTGFTYLPLNDNACTYNMPILLVNLTSCLDATVFQESCNLFPMKLNNLNGCPLIVSTFVHAPFMTIDNGKPSGSDGDLLCLIAEKLNGSLSVMTPRIGKGWGNLEKNNTWSGSFADIYYGYANFSITSAALTLARFTYFQLSTDYSSSRVVWLTRPATKISSSLKLTYPFQPDAQIAIVLSFAVVIICSLIIRSKLYNRLSRKISFDRPHSSIVFYSWMICMGLPTTRLPRKTAFLYIVLLWMWYGVLIRTLYQVSLISAMKSNYYYQEVETIDDAVGSEYDFGGGAALKDFYIDYPIVYNHWKDLKFQDIIPKLRNISKGLKYVLATDMQLAQTFIWDEKMHVHVLPQEVVTFPIVIFFKKYSPLAGSVNRVLRRLVESGFSEKLHKTYAATKVLTEIGSSIESINMEHCTGCYAVLITGWVLSFLLFVTEIVFCKIYGQHSAL